MKRPPFQMRGNRQATLTCNGKFVVAGRSHFVWETFLMRRIAGVPGIYEISARGLKRHRLDWTIGEAEEAMIGDRKPDRSSAFFGQRRLAQGRKTRDARIARGLPVG